MRRVKSAFDWGVWLFAANKFCEARPATNNRFSESFPKRFDNWVVLSTEEWVRKLVVKIRQV